MKFGEIFIKANTGSLEPELHITVNYSHRDECKILFKTICFVCLNGTRLAVMCEYSARGGSYDSFISPKSAKGSPGTDVKYFIAPLSRIALHTIEEARHQSAGDVIFNIQMEFTFMEPSFGTVINKEIKGKEYIMPYLQDEELLRFKTYFHNPQIRIPQSEWISKFSAKFESRHYQILEISTPNIVAGGDEMHIRINNAIKALPKMEKARELGEWNDVIEDSRKIWELINNEKEIDKLMKHVDMDEHAVKSFKELIKSLWGFSSKFHHKIPHGGGSPMKEPNASKEDAELIYTMAFSLVGFIAKKTYKHL